MDTKSVLEGTDETCPICKSNKYLSPLMKLLVSPCYHRMCDACADRLFSHGSAPCPFCKTILRKSNWVFQTFEDLAVEKECRIRKLISQYMNKVEEDFPDLCSYNDYLESFENYTFKLLSNEDVQQVYAELEQFRLESKDIIEKNLLKQMNEERMWNQYQIRENEEKRKRLDEQEKLEVEEAAKRQKEHDDFIDELAVSDQPASLLLEKRKNQNSATLRPSSMRTNAKVSRSNLPRLSQMSYNMHDTSDLPTPTSPFDPLDTCYQFPMAIELAPSYYDPMIEGWIDTLPVKAGGCKASIYHMKALQSAYRDLPSWIGQ